MIEQKHEVFTYIAKDGTTFYNKNDCVSYEAELARKEWREAFFNYVTRNSEADGFAPFDGDEHNESHSYTWVRPKSKSEIDTWNKLTKQSNSAQIPKDGIGKWWCIEEGNFEEDIWIRSLDYCIEYAEEVLRTFGIGIEVKPLTRFEYEDLIAAKERLGTSFSETLRIVKEYQDSTIGDIDDVIDIYEDEKENDNT